MRERIDLLNGQRIQFAPEQNRWSTRPERIHYGHTMPTQSLNNFRRAVLTDKIDDPFSGLNLLTGYLRMAVQVVAEVEQRSGHG